MGHAASRTKTGVQESPIHMLSYRGMAGIKNVHRALQSTADTVQFNQTLGFWRLPDVAHIRGEKGKL